MVCRWSISTYPVYRGRSVNGPFPHEVCNRPQCATALKPILNIPVTSVATCVLLMSSLAMVLALAAVENKDKPGWAGPGWGGRILESSKLWLLATAASASTIAREDMSSTKVDCDVTGMLRIGLNSSPAGHPASG